MRRSWIALALVLVVSFGVLLFVGSRIYQQAPPIPDRVVTEDGSELFGRGSIAKGQDVWRSFGGMELGSIWGHGAYHAPDWSADWLHRELVTVLDRWANRDYSVAFEALTGEQQAALKARRVSREHVRSGDAHAHRVGGPSARDRGDDRLLRGSVPSGKRELRAPCEDDHGSRSRARTLGVHLLDGVVGGDESPR